MGKRGILVVISGFSGAGKGTLVKRLLSDYRNYALSISMTTRNPREGEQDGKDYFFVSREMFEKSIEEEGFLEYASYCDNYYGTPKAYVEKCIEEGKDVILEIEVQGALQIKKKFPNSLSLFITPPSAAVLKERLLGRGTETAEVVQKRLQRAVTEAESMNAYDYIVVNDDLDACVLKTNDIIMAAHQTPNRVEDFIENISEELKIISKGE